MKEFKVQLSDAEVKALESVTASIQAMLDNFIHSRAGMAIDAVVEAYTDKQAGKLNEIEKEAIVNDANVLSLADLAALREKEE